MKSLADTNTYKESIESDLSNYKKVLNDTESVLKELQASIVKEEKKLLDKIEFITADNNEKVTVCI